MAARPVSVPFCKHTDATPHPPAYKEGENRVVFISNGESLLEKNDATYRGLSLSLQTEPRMGMPQEKDNTMRGWTVSTPRQRESYRANESRK